MKQNGSIVITILVITLVLVGIGGAYYLGSKNKLPEQQAVIPTPYPIQATTSIAPSPIPQTSSLESTVNWKSFPLKDESKLYEFSFKYPPEWEFESTLPLGDSLKLGPQVTESHTGEVVKPYVSDVVLLVVRPDDSGKRLGELKSMSSQLNPRWEDITIDNLNSTKVEHNGCSSGDCVNILLTRNGKLYEFSSQQFSINKKIINTFLSTFKFTK